MKTSLSELNFDKEINKEENEERKRSKSDSILILTLKKFIKKERKNIFKCEICYEIYSSSSSSSSLIKTTLTSKKNSNYLFKLINCNNKNHNYCLNCIQIYLKIQINEGNLIFKCPLFKECQSIFNLNEIKEIIDNDTYQKFQRFYEIKKNPNYRECPKCKQSIYGNENNPEIICSLCNYKYCFFHSDAHPNRTCQEFKLQQSKNDKLAEKIINNITRKCPSCNIPTEKNGGCNHMTCRQCGENWCWLCNGKVDRNHYEPTNLLGCPGQQFSSISFYADPFSFLRFYLPISLYYFILILILGSVIICCLPIIIPLFCLLFVFQIIFLPFAIFYLPHISKTLIEEVEQQQ